ncbi:glycine--tRNA ligase [Haladaptatus caseinilyticus]|uniref:glycine--tRNA ligase n=1 Tax=Haladaptatus caseinilyticus TaxID=2993314 RepID=UPI00224AEC85|nr:glycine--tRNA ligase [Haladaptatus caseinilyticus]
MSGELVELAKRRGYFFQAAEPYGGVSGFYVYGPQGAALKRNIEDSWRDRFQVQEGHREIEAPTIMPEPVFEASGHLDGFDDMLVECPECGESHRADHLIEDNTDIEDAESFPLDEVGDLIAEHDLHCPTCDTPLAGEPVEDFNLMFQTDIGPGSGQSGYLRPETAQGIFVEFPRLKEYARNRLPFGITQIGKAYRNEISPRKSIVRVREFTQAELEHFIDPEEDEPPLHRVEDVEVRLYSAPEQQDDEGRYLDTTVGEAVEEGIIASDWVAYYVGVAQEWYERIGIDMNRFRFRQHLAGERAHYASDCWDAEGEIDGDWIELAGISDRSDYDLSKHGEYSDEDFTVFRQYDEPKVVERATVDPDMSYLGPEFGGAAGDIADALQTLAERDRSAFDDDEVTVEANGESHTIPVEKTGFTVEEIKESGEHIMPHVIEPSIGVGRALYTVLVHAYEQDEVEGETRTRLALEPELAPTTVGVFPLMDKDGMGETAREIATDLRKDGFDVTYDDSGNIGRRYRRQDEVGTPFCVTVDYEGLEDDTVTLRERDSTEQRRVPVADLPDLLSSLKAGEISFDDLTENSLRNQ